MSPGDWRGRRKKGWDWRERRGGMGLEGEEGEEGEERLDWRGMGLEGDAVGTNTTPPPSSSI